MLSTVGFPSQDWCYRAVANSVNKQRPFDSTKFCEVSIRQFGAIESLRFPNVRAAKGGSTAQDFLKGVASPSELLHLADLKPEVR